MSWSGFTDAELDAYGASPQAYCKRQGFTSRQTERIALAWWARSDHRKQVLIAERQGLPPPPIPDAPSDQLDLFRDLLYP